MPIDVVKCIMVKDSSIDFRKKRLINGDTAVDLVRTLNLAESPQEQLWCICLDARLKPNCISMICQGTIDESAFDIQSIIRYALLSNSAAVIIVHNHPSGMSDPSAEDIDATRRLVQALDLFRIQLKDHIIVGDTFFSFSDHKLL